MGIFILEIMKEKIEKIRKKIAKSEIEEAIEAMYELLPDSDDLDLISGKWNRNEKQNQRGVLKPDDYERNQNIISKNLMDILKDLEKDEIDPRIKEYRDYLRSYFQQPALGDEKIRLSDIYIHPGMMIHRHCLSKKDNAKDAFTKINQFNSIHDFVNQDFLNAKNSLAVEGVQSAASKPKVLVLLGQPGQGKTSFCSKLLHDVLEEENNNNRNVYLLRLKELQDETDFVQNPLDVASAWIEQRVPCNLKGALLILDGLDELYMSAGLSDTDVNQIISALENGCAKYKGLQVILTSRTMYVKHIPHVSKKDTLVLHLDYLSQDQQIDWLRTYKKAYPKTKLTQAKIKEINSNEKFKNIKELINQPILLHLIAKADFEISEDSSKSKIYQTLFDRLIEREKKKNQKKFQHLNWDELRGVLRSIAFSIYKSHKEFITWEELEQDTYIQSFVSNDNIQGTKTALIKDALKEVLVNFYFQPTQNIKQQAIEFLHKSLQEYLAAEYVWHFIKREFLFKNDENIYKINTWKEALKTWQDNLLVPEWSEEFFNYYYGIIDEDENERKKKELFERMELFFPFLCKCNFIFEYECTFTINPYDISINNTYLYWQTKMKLNFRVGWDINDDFLAWLGNVEISLPLDLSNIKAWKASLKRINFTNSNLSGSNFTKSNFRGSVLINSLIVGSNFVTVNMIETNLNGSFVDKSNFSNTSFQGSDCHNVKFNNSNFVSCNFEQVDFTGADLSNSDFSHANFTRSNLNMVTLDNTNMSYSNFKDANLDLDDISFAKSLYGAINLPPRLEKQLRSTHPHLFEPPKED